MRVDSAGELEQGISFRVLKGPLRFTKAAREALQLCDAKTYVVVVRRLEPGISRPLISSLSTGVEPVDESPSWTGRPQDGDGGGLPHKSRG